MLILNKFDQFEKLNLTRDKACEFSPHILVLDVLTFAIQDAFLFLLWPPCGASLRNVLVLSCALHELKAIGFFIAVLNTHLVSCQVESLANSLATEEIRVERV